MQNEERQDVKSLSRAGLEESLVRLGEPRFRAEQIFAWLQKGAASFNDMTNISVSLRTKLDGEFYITKPKLQKKQMSADGTAKFLWELRDGECVETVVMKYQHGNTVCISSQVGCRMGCTFCASAIGGLVRNLSPSEMLDEVLYSEREYGDNISNVVLMGIGEPLDNFENVMRFFEIINDPRGRNIGMRRVSLSTCGPKEGIDKLAGFNLQLTLSVSLHAPDDGTRSQIMPVNRAEGVDSLLESCHRYFEKTGRRVSFEYAMMRNVNDTPFHAALLSKKLRHMGVHVNLIPLNAVAERDFQPSSSAQIEAFRKTLEDSGIGVTVRRRLGEDIDAACGQLRSKSGKQLH